MSIYLTKNSLYTCALSICLLCQGKTVIAQALPKAHVSAVMQVGQTVEFTITAPEPFYTGDNVFVLRIGSQLFDLSRQEDIDGKGKLVFLIPVQAFKSLPEGSKMSLSYGDTVDEQASDEEMDMAAGNAPNTSRNLGTFSKKLLIK
jgi:hypothetical protein